MKKIVKKTIKNLLLINNSLKKNKLIYPNQRVLIASSGGQDSCFLFYIFFIFKKQWNLKIFIISTNHLWTKEGFYTFLHLSKISYSLRISFVYTVNLTALISEENGRNWRFKIYLRLLLFINSQVILTGHTKSDQLETFFLNIARGSGLRGISSLKIKRQIIHKKIECFSISEIDLKLFQKLKNQNIFKFSFNEKKMKLLKKNKKKKKGLKNQIEILKFLKKKRLNIKSGKLFKKSLLRPLLNESRFDSQLFCNKLQLPIFPDISNQDFYYTRNRIRKQLVPTLRFFFNPQIEKILSTNNKIIFEEQQLIEKLVEELYTLIISSTENFTCLNLSFFYSFPLPIQRKICLLFFEKKLSRKSNFQTINGFVLLLNLKITLIKKTKYNSTPNFIPNWIFFPKIGILFFYKAILIVIF